MHVAIIMDGNRTWARNRGLPSLSGHKKGVDALNSVIQACPQLGVDVLTVYAFSTENFRRSPQEVDGILNTMADMADTNLHLFIENNIRVTLLGTLDNLPARVVHSLTQLVERTQHCDGAVLQAAVNYGGRDEIVRATKKVVAAGKEITEENISNYLDSTAEPDILIRTGGHVRISNFLMWQSAYTEFFFVQKNWPAFTGEDLANILKQFKTRTRKFGA